jgi:Xaa-Pro aminopeptidase
MTRRVDDEDVRATKLLDAQDKAAQLFAEIGTRGIIRPGVTEVQASDAIRDLAADMFGVERHWHKRIVRAGPNTLQPYQKNPPDREIGADDIAFADFGPIFEAWEADFGRTFVLGGDPVKQRLRDDLPVVWQAGREYFRRQPDVTGEQLYAHMVGLAEQAGWEFGGEIAGHLVGQTAVGWPATGSSKCTWSTGSGRSAASTRSCSTSGSPQCGQRPVRSVPLRRRADPPGPVNGAGGSVRSRRRR